MTNFNVGQRLPQGAQQYEPLGVPQLLFTKTRKESDFQGTCSVLACTTSQFSLTDIRQNMGLLSHRLAQVALQYRESKSQVKFNNPSKQLLPSSYRNHSKTDPWKSGPVPALYHLDPHKRPCMKRAAQVGSKAIPQEQGSAELPFGSGAQRRQV